MFCNDACRESDNLFLLVLCILVILLFVVGELSRTSKWIKQLVSTSPSAQHKAEDSNTSTAWRMALCNSSSKKKSRRRSLRPSYINGGLADRMQRMLERQKSNLSFWSYSKRNDNVESMSYIPHPETQPAS